MIPYLSNINYREDGSVRTISFGVKGDSYKLHYRIKPFGITNIKMTPDNYISYDGMGKVYSETTMRYKNSLRAMTDSLAEEISGKKLRWR